MNITAGEMIKTARIQAGLTQKQLAEKYEIPVRTLQDWELGLHKCPVYVLKLLIDRLAIDYCLQSETHMCEDPEDWKLGKEDYLYYLKNRTCDLYEMYADSIEGIDEFCEDTIALDEEDVAEIKSYLLQKYGEDWTYKHYRSAVISYLYNIRKCEVIGHPYKKEDILNPSQS